MVECQSLFLTATKINKCDEVIDNYLHVLKFVPGYDVTQKRIKLSILIILQCNLLLNAIRLKRCVIKQLIDVILHVFMFLIDIKLKKCVTVLFLKILLC